MPWDVDPAMKRPGRFSRQIFVPPPDAAARQRMLEVKLDRRAAAMRSTSTAIARKTAHYSGADVDGLIELAKEAALEDNIVNGTRALADRGRFRARAHEPAAVDAWIGCAPRATS